MWLPLLEVLETALALFLQPPKGCDSTPKQSGSTGKSPDFVFLARRLADEASGHFGEFSNCPLVQFHVTLDPAKSKMTRWCTVWKGHLKDRS